MKGYHRIGEIPRDRRNTAGVEKRNPERQVKSKERAEEKRRP